MFINELVGWYPMITLANLDGDRMNALFGKILDELKTVPITMMFLAGLYIAVAMLWTDHVSKADFLELKTQLSGVQETLQRDHADSELHKVESELFSLTQHITEQRAKGLDVDRLYYQRIDDLTNRRAELMRFIARIDARANSAAISP